MQEFITSEKYSVDTFSPQIGIDWVYWFWDFMISTEMEKIIDALAKNHRPRRVFPSYPDWFRAFRLCTVANLKVVIVGDEPHAEEGLSDGLAFSSKNPIKCPSPLANIFSEVENDIYNGNNTITTGINNLDRWATQGVLLLNSALTVEEGRPGSHKELWKPFSEYVMKTLGNWSQGVVFILCGEDAHKYEEFIDTEQNWVLKTANPPSHLGAHGGFKGYHLFSKTNQILSSLDEEPIEW